MEMSDNRSPGQQVNPSPVSKLEECLCLYMSDELERIEQSTMSTVSSKKEEQMKVFSVHGQKH